MKIYKVALISFISLVIGIFIGIPIPSEYAASFIGYKEHHNGQTKLINKLLDYDIPPSNELGDFRGKLQQLVDKSIDDKKANRLAVYYRDLNNGPWAGANEGDKFIPASLLKIPLMMTYFKNAEDNPSFLSKKYKYNAVDFPNNQKMHYDAKSKLVDGKEYTVDELIRRMIIYSDNAALDILTTHADLNKQTELYTKLGIKLPDVSKTEEFLSPRAMSAFLRVLYNATYLNEDMSEKALKLLAETEFNKGITAGVPSNIVVAQKYGERDNMDFIELHDCGIIYFPNHPYILCVMSQGNDYDELSGVIKDISKFTYEQVKESNK